MGGEGKRKATAIEREDARNSGHCDQAAQEIPVKRQENKVFQFPGFFFFLVVLEFELRA
jgi:hypothetical protein